MMSLILSLQRYWRRDDDSGDKQEEEGMYGEGS
jgi:hypothetical protein